MRKPHRGLLLACLAAWIAGVLFPMRAATRAHAGCGRMFDWLFHTHASHVLMHTFLYAVLAGLLTSFWSGRTRSFGHLCARVLPVVAVVAGLQEALQAIFARTAPGGDAIFDVLVDLNGGLLGVLLGVRWARGPATAKGEDGHDTRSPL